jgi:hypothetical protein
MGGFFLGASAEICRKGTAFRVLPSRISSRVCHYPQTLIALQDQNHTQHDLNAKADQV